MAHGLLNSVLLELVGTDLLRKFQWLEAAQKDRRGRHPSQTVFLCPIPGLGEMGTPPGRSAAAGPGGGVRLRGARLASRVHAEVGVGAAAGPGGVGDTVEGRPPSLQAAHRGGC